MALSAADALASFDNSTTAHTDLLPLLAAILVSDTATLGAIGMGPAVMGTNPKVNEDSLNAPQVVINEGAEFSASDVTLTVVGVATVRVGALLMDLAAGKTEIMQVTAIVGLDLTVTRGFRSSTAQTHADAATLRIISQPHQEGDTTKQSDAKARTQVSNSTQIFKKEVTISGTAEAVTNNGLHPGISSEKQHQLLFRALEMKVEMNQTALYSLLGSDEDGSDTVYRTMKGIREFLTQSGGNHTSTAEALGEKVINDLYSLAWDDGGTPKLAVSSDEQIRRFAAFNSAKIRIAPSDRVAGVFVNKYLTEYGAELDLVLDRWHRDDEVELIDPTRMYWAPLNGRGMFTEDLAKTGDSSDAMLVAEGTIIVLNAKEAHSIHSALSVG